MTSPIQVASLVRPSHDSAHSCLSRNSPVTDPSSQIACQPTSGNMRCKQPEQQVWCRQADACMCTSVFVRVADTQCVAEALGACTGMVPAPMGMQPGMMMANGMPMQPGMAMGAPGMMGMPMQPH